ncbi:hypothetical protein FRB97_003741 [Tulasnella sp. 331]|nr:hypothetical protein FRB97_003741 [Tulasnella sp. 331]
MPVGFSLLSSYVSSVYIQLLILLFKGLTYTLYALINSLTPSVLVEALTTSRTQAPTAVIISYHPPIFSALKSLTLANPLQRSLLTCAAHGISVYCPHTSLDVTRGGINDWLASATMDRSTDCKVEEIGKIQETEDKCMLVQVAKSPTGPDHITSVALCAGSGGSVIGNTPADVYFTGEMVHHDVLAAVASNTHVVLCGHTNTERPYLPTLKERLEEELAKDYPVKEDMLQVVVSQADAHPLMIV